MDFGVSDLVNELKILRRGFGIESADVTDTVGDALQVVCGVTPGDSAETARRKLCTVLGRLTDQLPADQRLIARTALGFDGAAVVRYQDRVRRLAVHLERDARTAQRRVDDVFRRLAELAFESRPRRQPSARAVPWHTLRLEVLVLLDLPEFEVLETRRVVSHEAELTDIDHSITVVTPPDWAGSLDPAILGVDVFSGAVLDTPQLQGPKRLGFRLRLPQPLGRGEEHEFSFRVKVRGPFEPYYVCTPRYPCDRFDLMVRFGPHGVPARIWSLDNEFPLELNDRWPERKPIEANRAGEARVRFTDLEPHRSYGIGWEPRADQG